MYLLRVCGWGFLIYASVYLMWNTLVIHGLSGMYVSQLIVLATLIGIVTYATLSQPYLSERDIIPLAFGWAVMQALIDTIVVVPYAGYALFGSCHLWVGYSLVFLVPLLMVAVRARQRGTGI